MNPEIKAAWVAALRSGDYKQGGTVLRRRDRYCCLGVLCDLAVKAGVIPEPTPSFTMDLVYEYGAEKDPRFLPRAVCDWAALDGCWIQRNPIVGDYTATQLNDAQRLNFGEIAELIEEHL